jgi:hypothetical protein
MAGIGFELKKYTEKKVFPEVYLVQCIVQLLQLDL